MCCILIVEDNSLFRSTLKGILKKEFPGVNIEEASSYGEALAKIQTFRPIVMIVDIKIPGKNGLELTKIIKSTHQEIEVIIFTSYDILEYRKAAESCGATHFFTKGVSHVSDITAAVASLAKRSAACSRIFNTLEGQ